MAKQDNKVYHCEPYYHPNVCPSRGEVDEADIRKSGSGWNRQKRFICKTKGLCPLTNYNLCGHCTEWKHMFRKPSRVLTGKVIEVTPFKAIRPNYSVAKAYKTKKSLMKYVSDKPELTAMNVITGEVFNWGV